MPADTEKARPWTPETSTSGRVAVAPMEAMAPAGPAACACDDCVDRDEMWSRWA